MATTLLIRHSVESYDEWKPGFDGHGDNRRLHGASGHRVLRDGNQVTILIDFPDRGSAEAFTSDPALRDAMGKAGVIGTPELAMLEPTEDVRY